MIFGRKARRDDAVARPAAPAAPVPPAPEPPAPEPPAPEPPAPSATTDAPRPDDVAPTVVPSRPVELRVLLLTSGDGEPSAQAWQALLDGEGVPYDLVVAGVERLTARTLVDDDGFGRYQAVVLATDALVRLRDDVYESSLDPDEWTTLRDYLRDFGVRQVSAYATPGPAVGLEPAGWAGDVGDAVASLTPAGRAVFTDLVGDVPLSAGTYGYRTAVLDADVFTPLVVGADDSPVVGTVVHPDGRQELLLTVASGVFSRHMHLLGHGMVSWVTRGRRLAHHGHHLSMQVDDILLGATVGPGADPIRMGSEDVAATAAWTRRTGIRLDFAYNAWGAVTATEDGTTDPLTESVVAGAADFNWVNHTFGHLDLDQASTETVVDEIRRNLAWAEANDIDVPADVLVTGAHSGLDNPALAVAAEVCGLRWIASDASRSPRIRSLGAARLVPRHPVNIPLDVCTLEGLHDRHHGSTPTATAAGVSVLERGTEVLAGEHALILTHLLSNDPRPHYTHQNTLVGERLLLMLLDDVLASFARLVRRRPVQLTLAEAGLELVRRAAWADAVRGRTVVARQRDDVVEVRNLSPDPVEIPWPGASDDGGWIELPGLARLRLR